MFTLTYKQLDQGIPALRLLSSEVPLPTKVAYQVGKMKQKVEQELKKANTEYLRILKAHTVLDEKGNPAAPAPELTKLPDGREVLKPTGRTHTFLEGHEELFQKEFEAFLDSSTQIDRDKLTMAMLGDAKLTGDDLLQLEPFFQEEVTPQTLEKPKLTIAPAADSSV